MITIENANKITIEKQNKLRTNDNSLLKYGNFDLKKQL